MLTCRSTAASSRSAETTTSSTGMPCARA
jgi:hypothetical protein